MYTTISYMYTPLKIYPGLTLTPKLNPNTNHTFSGPSGGPSRTGP